MSLLESLHGEKRNCTPQLRVFYYAFAAMFVWEVFPEYIMPLLTAVSIFCLANRNSSMHTLMLKICIIGANTQAY